MNTQPKLRSLCCWSVTDLKADFGSESPSTPRQESVDLQPKLYAFPTYYIDASVHCSRHHTRCIPAKDTVCEKRCISSMIFKRSIAWYRRRFFTLANSHVHKNVQP